MAATSIFLKLGPIKGSSEVDGFKEEIDIDSWAWGATNTRHMGVGSATTGGNSDTQPLSFTKKLDAASTNLMNYCQSAEKIPEATLSLTKQVDKKAKAYFTVELKNVFVSSYSISGSGEGEATMYDNFTLSFEECKYDYTGQKPDGSFAASSPKSWNVNKNAEK